ncbi:MAG: glycosyltransferase family 39 protein [Caldimonas sp.]
MIVFSAAASRAAGIPQRFRDAGRQDLPIVVLLVLLCLGQVMLWGFGFGLNYSAPEIDSAEQFVWAYSLESGYWKHPPMPTWILHALIQLFGTSVVLPFIATQVCVVVALALVWRLGCEFVGPVRALIAVALTSLVTYHNISADCFNHSTVLLPFQAATLLFFFRATRRPAPHLWILTGLFAGFSMLVKYVALVPICGLLLYFAIDRSLHTRRHAIGLLTAAGVFCLVLTPHALWLGSTDFLPFRYARSVAQSLPGLGATLRSLGDFVLMQLVRLLPFLMALGIVLWRRRGEPREFAAPAVAPRDRLFLWIAAAAPLVGTVLIGLLGETELQSRWGSNAFLLVGLVPMMWVRRRDPTPLLRRAIPVVVAFHVVLCIGLTLGKTVVADRIGIRTRANFPGAELARKAQETWQAHVDAPLRIVVSDIWLGGNVIANTQQHVAVLIDGRHFKSPWVNEAAVIDCGVLILDDLTPDRAGHAVPNPAIERLMVHAQATGTWKLPWARPQLHEGADDRGLVRWGIVLPKSTAGCKLH